MSLNDPIADTLTRIRNGQSASILTVDLPYSNMNEGLVSVLKNEGFLDDYEVQQPKDGGHKIIKTKLRYSNGKPAIKSIERVSKPGRRVYSKIDQLKSFYNGLGVVILSTPKGVISDNDAKKHNVGGEIICKVF